MIAHLLWFFSVVLGLNRPPRGATNCPDLVEVDDQSEWLDDPDETTNDRLYAEHCYGLPAARK